MENNLAFGSIDDFYLLARTVMVKDEKYYDRFDKAFGAYFKNLENIEGIVEALIPEDWMRKEFEKHFTDEEKAKIESLGGLEKLIEEFKKRLEEQQKRHEGGNKWVGTNGTSPFGHGGFNPEGIRIGGPGGKGTAVKVWDERQYQDLDDSVEIGTRNIKVALRRLRKFAREGSADQLDLDDTIRSTARNAGYLDIKMVPERHNAVKVLIFFDIGRRREEKMSVFDLMHKYSSDYKVIYVGDASMAPYEVTSPGGSVEYHNEESGAVWMHRMAETYDKLIWINPVQEKYWEYTPSIQMLKELVEDKMFPMTLAGLEKGMARLSR